jgi:hydroxymethylpyrimidine/phosphomethylpyrimidine kinase
MIPPIALTIAGSDPSGGAGLQADLKTFHRFGCYGMSVVTLVTAQNTRGVSRVDLLGEETVLAQLEAVWSDLPPAALKTGAIGSAPLIAAVAGFLASRPGPPLVLDPVMISKHGHRLLPDDAVQAMTRLLLPRAAVVTPNWHEAAALAGAPVTDLAGARAAARELRARGAAAVLVKGGAGADGLAADLLLDADGELELPALRLATRATHGTGCTFAAALTAHLAHGLALRDAALRAKAYIHHAIASAPGLGGGLGPVDHWA